MGNDKNMNEIERVLVTGGTGFIGSHLIPELIKRSYDVYNMERYVTGRIRRGDKTVKRICANCQFYQKIAENAGICNKYKFLVHLSLAKKCRVCEGME